MKASRLLLCCIAIIIGTVAHAQQMRAYTPVIEPCACPVQVDSSFKTQCGYLVVPENRYKHNSKTVKLPFIVVKSNNPAKRKDPLLFTSGGPGGSSLGWVRGITRHNVIQNRDCIAFEQRGTRYAIPNLWGPELDDAIREAYRKNLPKDSMVLAGVQRYKKALQAKGIDLSGYNTDETVEDIEDLLKTLQIDSVNLLGGSYSGGLMMAVLRRDSARVRSLLLDCPLPTFIPIDQDEPANFNEALKALSLHCAKDSANRERYGNLMEKFQAYFSSIGHQSFYIPYVEKGTTDTLHIRYTRNELLDVVENALQDHARLKEAPFIITELTRGHHYPYIKNLLDGVFNGSAPSGMRISVYCADQTAYHEEAILQQLYQAYPYMEGYHINDVYKAICDCWQVPPIKASTKQPFYSAKPALLGSGEMDPACRPLYIDMIHHYLPNSQRILCISQPHMVFGTKGISTIIEAFLDDPFKKISSTQKDIIVY